MGYRRMLRKQLQNECRVRGLTVSGKKDDLIERLEEDDEEQELIGEMSSPPARSSHASPSKKRIFDLQSDSEDDEIEVAQSLSAVEALQKKFSDAAASGAILELQDDDGDDDDSPPVKVTSSATTTSSTTAAFTPPRFPKGYAVKMEKEKRAKPESTPTKKQKVVDLSLDVSDDEIEVLDVTPSGKSNAGKSNAGAPSPVTPEKRKKNAPPTAPPIIKGCLKSDGVGTEDRLYLHKWFIHVDAPVHKELVNMFKNGARALRTYVDVSFSEKDEAKERFKGSIFWDNEKKSWYCWKDSHREGEMLAKYGQKDFNLTYYYRNYEDY
ncbi:hypothetical protein TrRE_jg2053 [Triparma retinervis]|uniref:SAP domain-containing protein n=1 Tax=Triparma retinervis TaxID=2557542 RepID=A0A9W6Z8Y8_9STRA|nr:hypothetical protein TrRE_jg2053 [Triparma retinervis]